MARAIAWDKDRYLACKVKLTFRILAFLYKLTTQICHFDEFLLIKWPISKNYYPKLAGVRNVHETKYETGAVPALKSRMAALMLIS